MNVVITQDQVPRLEKFRSEHPDIKIIPPGPRTMLWRAEKNGERVAEAFWLGRLLDTLEAHLV